MSLTINQWIEKGKNLPILSGSIAKILSLTDGGESNISQVAEVIKRDMTLSAAVLRITNSAAFGSLRTITTIDQAVMMLGFKSIRNIALGVGVFNLFPPHEKEFLSKVWQRSLLTGLAARELCVLTGEKRKEDAFTMGLLHDIGLVAFYGYDKNRATDLLKKSEAEGRMHLIDEKNYLGLDHIEAGRLLAEKWKLPEEIIHIIVQHHKEPTVNTSDKNNTRFSQIIYLASLVGDIFYLGNKMESIKKFNEGCQRLLVISADDADNLLQKMHPQLVEVAAYFDIAVGSGKTYEEILTIVNEEIANITISNEAINHHLSKAFDRERAMAKRLEEANRNLQMMAGKDPLTGLYNRQFLDEMLKKEWSRSQRNDYSLSMIMVDIDDFKGVNDSYGHPVGDMVLKKVAEVLAENLRNNDFLARYGGEEFVFVLPQTDLEAACTAAERFRKAIEEIIIPADEDRKLTLTISCGVSTAYPGMGAENTEALIVKADKALYRAKRTGKNRVVSYEDQNMSSGQVISMHSMRGKRYDRICKYD